MGKQMQTPIEVVPEGKNPGPDKAPPPQYVTSEQFDQFARAVGQQFSEMREEYEQRILDLEAVVGAGSAVTFHELGGPEQPDPDDDVPWHEPSYGV